jgi:nicotinamide-nucleotide amidase
MVQTTDQGPHPRAQALGAFLSRQSEFVVTAESCTGGLISAALTSVAGSSGWFDRGWVTYTNEAKQQQLGVTQQSLDEFGAVSEQVVREMAAGALAMAARATLSMAVTGIAGPGGGSVDKPVGLVWFGFARRTPDGVVVTALNQVFEGDRQAVRQASVEFALSQALSWSEQAL